MCIGMVSIYKILHSNANINVEKPLKDFKHSILGKSKSCTS